MDPSPSAFLDVPVLLESSLPRQRNNWFWYALGLFFLVTLTSSLSSAGHPQLQAVMRLLGGVVMIGLVVATLVVTSISVRQQKLEQQQLESIEELVQLRRWDQAAGMLQQMLLEPARSPAGRIQALIYLSSVLGRYHRYADSIAVHDYLMEHVEFDPGTVRGIKLMRAMAMLHEDRLFDVDGAINDLRRESPDSAGLALVEMYRDVKTGHPAEAIDTFSAHLSDMRTQLGQRLSDAYALAARAHDLMGQEDQAAAAVEKATLLCPAEELARKYAEFAAIKDKYPAARTPGAPGNFPAPPPAGAAQPAPATQAAETPVSIPPATSPMEEATQAPAPDSAAASAESSSGEPVSSDSPPTEQTPGHERGAGA